MEAKQLSMSGLLLSLVSVAVFFYFNSFVFAHFIIVGASLLAFVYAIAGIIENNKDVGNTAFFVGLLAVIICLVPIIMGDAIAVVLSEILTP